MFTSPESWIGPSRNYQQVTGVRRPQACAGSNLLPGPAGNNQELGSAETIHAIFNRSVRKRLLSSSDPIVTRIQFSKPAVVHGLTITSNGSNFSANELLLQPQLIKRKFVADSDNRKTVFLEHLADPFPFFLILVQKTVTTGI